MIKVNEKLIENVKDSLLSESVFSGIKTGFNNIDFLSYGLANGQLIILGARSSMGKTTFAYSLIDNVCINGGKSCACFTSEMSVSQMIERLIRLHGNVKFFEKTEQRVFQIITKAASDMEHAKLWIDDTRVGAGDEFIESCRKIGKLERLDLVIIDYIQLFESDTKDLNEILMSLKQLAVELKCPVLILTQLNRSVEKRRNHMPRISDIPYAEIVEKWADEILFLYRDAYYDRRANINRATVNIAKHDKCRMVNTSICYDPDIPAFRNDDELHNGRCEK